MKIVDTYLDDVYLIQSPFFEDERGNFLKVFNRDTALFNRFSIQQVNHVTSRHRYTLRGLHYQQNQWAEAKCFRVLKGGIQLAFFDTRRENSSFAKSDSVLLNASDSCILVPRGYATGYLTLEADTSVLYLSDNIYQPDAEAGLRWDDPILSINWKTEQPKLSEKDRSWENFS
jgi:dTDP-4-dehydrorhamnose 3,5-epimerase